MKFLRGKVWQIVLAVCMLVVLLCITASASGVAEATVTIYDVPYTVNEETSHYLKTDANGAITSTTVEAGDHTIALEIIDGVPTMTLNGATIKHETNALSITSNTGEFVIKTDAASSIEHSTAEAKNDSTRAAITFTGKLIFRGSALLEVTGGNNALYGTSPASLQFDHTNVKVVTTAGQWGSAALSKSIATIDVDGGTVVVHAQKYMLMYCGATTVTVDDGGHLTLQADGSTVNWNNATYNVKNGTLITKAKHASMFSGGGGTGTVVKVDANGVWEAINLNASGKVLDKKPTLFRGCYAVTGASKETATAYNGTDALTGQYFKVGKPATVTITDGIAQAFGVKSVADSENSSVHTLTAMIGDTVTVSVPEGLKFNAWTVDEGPDGFTINSLANAATAPTTFTMPNGDVSLTASTTKSADVLLLGNTYTITGEEQYYTTDGSGALVEATKDTYTVKLVYNGNIPTVYLKNANLSYVDSVIENGTGTTVFAIETEAPSTVHQTGNATQNAEGKDIAETRGSVKTSGKVIFRGDALLTLKGGANGIYGSNSAEFVFEKSNVDLSRTGTWSEWYDSAFYGSIKSITFDGGKATITAPRIFAQIKITYNIIGGANVTMKAPNSYLAYNVSSTFNVVDGYLHLEGNTAAAMLNTSEINVSTNGIFEAYNKNASGTITSKVPTWDSTNHYAVIGASKAEANVYTSGALSSRYFAVGKPTTVTVQGGSVTAFGITPATDEQDPTKKTVTAIIGVDVTLTADTPADGESFAWWTADAAGTFANAGAATTTFTPDGAVTITAHFGKQTSITIGSTAYMAYQGLDAVYFTTANGTAVRGGNEDTYNIKFVYPEGEEATPVLYLRGAYLTQKIASNANTLAGTTIVVEKVGEYPSTVPNTAYGELEPKPDSYLTAGITWGKDLTITGYTGNAQNPTLADFGRLKMSTGAARLFNSSYQLTMKNLNFDGAANGSCIPASTTFDGGKVNIASGASVLTVWADAAATDTTAKGITVTGGADVALSGTGNVICFYYATNAKIIINEGSKLKVTSNGQAIRAKQSETSEDVIQINGGTLESSGSSAGYSETYAKMSGEASAYFITRNNSTTNATTVKLTDYGYVKIEPAYAISATDGGTASVKTDRVTVATATKAPAGATVTLTPAAKSGYRFYQWTFGNDSQKPPITNNTFTMPAGAVSVVANYDEIKTIKILGVAHDFTAHEPLYFIANGGVTPLTQGDLERSYNIKLAVVSGVPTVYLKGATVTSTTSDVRIIENGTNVSEFAIVTESDSVLNSYSNAIYVNRADLTLSGTGKLSLFGNTNPESTSAWSGASTICINHYAAGDAEESKVVRTITLDEKANVYIRSHTKPTIDGTAGIWSEPNINANVIAENGCSLEVESDTNVFYAGINLTIANDYTDWAAVTGASKEAATGYGGGVNPPRGNKYFKIAPGYTVTVDGGTASGASSNGGRFLPGTSVTLTPGSAETGKAFWKWTTEDKIDIASNQFTMIDSNVSVEAALQKKGTVYFKDGTPYSALEKTSTYLKTKDDNAPILGTEADHNIELKYTDGIPAVHLKGAALTSTAATYCLSHGTDITDLLIVVERDSSITGAGLCIEMKKANLTIKGPGKLTINSNTDGTYTYGSGGAITVTHDDATKPWYTITIAENADVSMYTNSVNGAYTGCIWNNPNGKGKLVIENGAKLEMASPSLLSYSTTEVEIDAEYTDWAAVIGTSQAAATGYTGANLSSQKYFKIAPGKVVTIENGTSTVLSNGGRAFKGVDVKLTPNEPAAGKGFAYWTSAKLLGEDKNYNSSYSFTMGEEAVTVTAHYGNTASVSICGIPRTIVNGGKPVYLLTDSETGTPTTTGASDSAYNIMLAFDGDVPTVYLNGATIITDNHGIQNGTDVSNMAINVQAASTITSNNNYGIFMLKSDLTITGSGKLTVTSVTSHGILFQSESGADNNTLTFDEADVKIVATANSQCGIFELYYNIDVIMDNSIVEVISTYHNWGSYGGTATNSNNSPTIIGDCVAIQGQKYGDPSKYWAFAAGSIMDQGYFRVEPRHVEVTITWGAMTFTYSGAQWNVETLDWEGIWVPSNEVVDGVAANQIKVENTGTDTVYVSFAFTTTNSELTNPSAVDGKFMNSADAATATELADGQELARFAELDAFLNLSSATVAAFENGATLGTVTVTISDTAPAAQGGNA